MHCTMCCNKTADNTILSLKKKMENIFSVCKLFSLLSCLFFFCFLFIALSFSYFTSFVDYCCCGCVAITSIHCLQETTTIAKKDKKENVKPIHIVSFLACSCFLLNIIPLLIFLFRFSMLLLFFKFIDQEVKDVREAKVL